MSRRQIKYLSVPIHIWTHPDLSVNEKVVLIDIDSYCASNVGVSIGAQTISSGCGLSVKEVKEALKSLYSKGAIEVNVDDNGQKSLIPLLYKERYVTSVERKIIGDKPADSTPLPYDEIAEKWAEYCPNLPAITRWSPQRKNKLKRTMKQAGLEIKELYQCFRIIGATPFLNGTGEFRATFMWLTSKSDNMQKVYEGFYARSYAEKSSYENIMHGGEAKQQSSSDDEYYR